MSKPLTCAALLLLVFAQAGRAQRRRSTTTPAPPSPGQARATHEADRAKLKAQADELARAFFIGDFEKLADLTYPDLVKLLGGKTRMIVQLERDVQEARSEGFEPVSYAAGEPTQTVGVPGGRLFAVLPTTLRAKVREGVLAGQSYLIGVSDDGVVWKFVDGSSVDKSKLRVLFGSGVIDKLSLPELKPPILEKR